MGIIYKATNTLTGMVYIGQSKNKLSKRKAQHKYDAFHFRKGEGCQFHKAIREHGFEVFSWEVVEEVELNNLDEHESFWINHFKEIAYNVKEVY